MTWFACTFMIRAKACCQLRACSRLKVQRPGSCWNWIPAVRWSGRNLPEPMRNDWPNWIAPCGVPGLIPSVSARRSLLRKHCSGSLKRGGDGGEGEEYSKSEIRILDDCGSLLFLCHTSVCSDEPHC